MRKRKLIACALVTATLVSPSIVQAADVTPTPIAEQVEVTAKKPSVYRVTIPKKVTLNGEAGTGSYSVSITGDFAAGEYVEVIPDNSFYMKQEGKTDVLTTVSQVKTKFEQTDLVKQAGGEYSASTTGTIAMAEITAGDWEGSFDFTINAAINSSVTATTDSVTETKDVTGN